MMQPWRWAGACSIGSSHTTSGLPCQDRASCIVVSVAEQQFVSAVVSDGAGSASEGARGAAIVCSSFQRLLLRHLRERKSLAAVDDVTMADWIDEIRERINFVSGQAERRP